MTLTLGGPDVDGLAALHAQIRSHPDVPDWYGANLDALSDLLTSGRVDVVLRQPHALRAALGEDDFARLTDVLLDAAHDNPRLSLRWEASQ